MHPKSNIMLERYRHHYGALTKLGVPIVIGQVGNIILSFADTLMVGQHSMEELAAASFVNSMVILVVIFAMGFSYGLTPMVGNLFGRGEMDKIGGVVRNGMVANTVMELIVVVPRVLLYMFVDRMGQPNELIPLMRPYLLVNLLSVPFVCWLNVFKQFYDAVSDTKVPMYVFLGGNMLNIIGNYLLIFGKMGLPELGLLGAGIATAVSRVVMLLVMAAIFFWHKRYRIYSEGYRKGCINRKDFGRLNSLGWPLAVQMGMETAAFSVMSLFVGWIGTTALAAHQIMLTVSQLFYMVYYGMAAAVAVRVSHFHGQGDMQEVRETAKAGFHIILLIAAVVSVPIFLLRNDISLLFTNDAEVCTLVAQTVIPLILYQFGDGLQCTYANALRGISCVRPMVISAFISYVLVSIPLSWLLGIKLGFGLPGVWFTYPITLTLVGAMYYWSFRKRV